MKSEYQSKLMECIFKALRVRSYAKTSFSRGHFNKGAIKCKRAEQAGDYKTAYEELLKLFERHLNSFARGHIINGDTNHLTLIYNIPAESIGKGSDVMYATAALYNLHKMGFPKPREQYGWRSHYNDKFILRIDKNHEHVGELNIITKEEYDNPFKFHPEYKYSSFDKPVLKGESWINFASDSCDNDLSIDEFRINYKVVDRGLSKHNYVFLECDGHYYAYCWQFSCG